MSPDPFTLAGEAFRSRLLLGTAGYPTQRILVEAAAASGCEIVTVSIRRSSLKGHGFDTVDLTWSGATSSNVDIYRNGPILVTVPNTGSYTDSTGQKGHATFTYKVCNAGTPTCSNQVTVTF